MEVKFEHTNLSKLIKTLIELKVSEIVNYGLSDSHILSNIM